MFINKNSIIIDGINMGQYIVEAKFGYHKAWASDTGRNTLSGNFSGTFIGIFPKLTLQFRKLSREEVELLSPILNKARQTVTYYDPEKQQNVTITTYSNDWEMVNKQVIQTGRKAPGFSCAFISTKKRD